MRNVADYIDHTNLKQDAVEKDLAKLCAEAIKFKCHSVCVNPCNVKYVAEKLKGSGVKVCSVVGFPLGATTGAVKAAEAAEAVKNGADEIDMVINVGAVKDAEYARAGDEIKAVRAAVGKKIYLKVIIETCLLTKDEIVRCSSLIKECGADCVKTSTGFSKAGADVENVKLMRKTVGADFGVKASGGIRDYKTFKAMVEAGADRIGCSSTGAIIEESMNG